MKLQTRSLVGGTLALALATSGVHIAKNQLQASEARFRTKIKNLNRNMMTEREENLRRLSQQGLAHVLVITTNPLTDSDFQVALSTVSCPEPSFSAIPLAFYLSNELTSLSRREAVHQEVANGLNCYSFEPVCMQYHRKLLDATKIYLQRRVIVQRCYDQTIAP